MSQFNLENVTSYNTKAEEYDLARKNVSFQPRMMVVMLCSNALYMIWHA